MRARGFARRCPLLFWMTTALQKAPLSHTGSDFLDVVSGCRKTQDSRDFGWRIANVGCFEAGIEQEKIIPIYINIPAIIDYSYLQICVFGECLSVYVHCTFFFYVCLLGSSLSGGFSVATRTALRSLSMHEHSETAILLFVFSIMLYMTICLCLVEGTFAVGTYLTPVQTCDKVFSYCQRFLFTVWKK